jgi:pheromone shutdown protein TraB
MGSGRTTKYIILSCVLCAFKLVCSLPLSRPILLSWYLMVSSFSALGKAALRAPPTLSALGSGRGAWLVVYCRTTLGLGRIEWHTRTLSMPWIHVRVNQYRLQHIHGWAFLLF